MDFEEILEECFMVPNETLVYQIQQARAAGDNDTVERLTAQLYEQNKGLIFETSLGYKNLYAKCEADREDFDSVAKRAFIEATYSYDPSKDATFASWAKYNVMNFALRDYVRKDKLIQIPDKLQALIKLHDEIVKAYKESHDGMMPTDKKILVEMNKKVNVSPKRFEDIKAGKEALEFVSLDTPLDEQGTTGEELVDRIDFSMEVKSPEDLFMEEGDSRILSEEYAAVRKMIQKLSQLEQDILRMVYFEGMKQTEVAKILGKDKQYVNKKLKQAYKHLLKMKEVQNIGIDRGWLSGN